MKFHNQKSFMGHEISNVTNKPLLHKKGKQWIVVAVSALILAGFGGVVSTTTHADTTNNGAQTESVASGQANGSANKVSQPNTQTITNQAGNLHKNLVNNSAKNNNYVHPHMMLQNIQANPTIQTTSNGTWGTAKWHLDNGNLFIHDGNLDGVNNFVGVNKGANSYYSGQSSKNSDNQPEQGALDENAVKSIKVRNVVAPSNAGGLFSGDNGQWGGLSNWNHFNNVNSIDLSGLDTSNTSNMASMFHGCGQLTNIVFGPTFNTNKVTDMNSMFDDDASIRSLDMNSFNTNNVNNYSAMFWNTPSLESLDLSNFNIKNGANVSSMFWMSNGNVAGEPTGPNRKQNLKELVLNPSFKNINTGTACLNNGGIGNSPSLFNPNNPTLNSTQNKTISNWSDTVNTTYNNWTETNDANTPGIWISNNDKQVYDIQFHDEITHDLIPSSTQETFYGLQDASFLPINGVKLPSGYKLSPNAGTTAIIQKTSPDNLAKDASGNYYATTYVIKASDQAGTWGSADWILGSNGTLRLINGELESSTVPSKLKPYSNQITSIQTDSDHKVFAPGDAANLFKNFNNLTSVDLSGIDFTPSYNVKNLLPSDVEAQYNSTFDTALDNQEVNDVTSLSDIAHHASASANTNSEWISNSGKPASSSANNAWNWVSNNSQSESNASAKADTNSNNINTNSASASNSASSAVSQASTNAASIYEKSASVNDLIKSLSVGNGSAVTIQNAINSAASSAVTVNKNNVATQTEFDKLFSGSNESNTIASVANDIASTVAKQVANNSSASYETKDEASSKADNADINDEIINLVESNGVIDTLANSIATSYASSAVNWVNANGSNVSNKANTNATNISNDSANASNSAKNAEINAFGEAYVNNQVVAASVASSIANTVDSINTHIGSSYASAIASAQNLASSAKSSAEAQAQTDAKSAFSSASSYANSLSSAASNSISASEKAMNTNMAKNSANASSSVASLSGSANTASASASKGISSNAKNISNNSNNINTNSNTASNGISNANASASASASVASSNAQSVANKNSASASASVSAANSEAQSLANQNSLSASISAANANSNADAYALSLANNAINTTNTTAGGIDNTMSSNDQTVQSLSNTVSNNTISLANNDNDLYMTKENKSDHKQEQQPQQVVSPQIRKVAYLYVLKPVWLHTSAKFTKHNRAKALTAKHGYTLPITKVFRVHGALRFEVKMNGKHYFVTGQKKFTRNAYIQPNEINHHSSVKLLQNIREYKKAGFGDKNFIRNFKKGAVLPVKRAVLISSKRMTRLQLTNGHWITANKNLVKLI